MRGFPTPPPGEVALPADGPAAWALLTRMDARDCAEAVGLVGYWGADSTRDGNHRGGRRRPVLRPPQFEKETA